jgi:hypothetical protein
MSKFVQWLQKLIRDYPWIKVISIVGLIEGLGGLLLMFVLGVKAWTRLGRGYRLCAGSLVVGITLGYIFYFRCPDLLKTEIDSSARPWIAFGVIPIVLLASTFYLDSLRIRLDRPTGTGSG